MWSVRSPGNSSPSGPAAQCSSRCFCSIGRNGGGTWTVRIPLTVFGALTARPQFGHAPLAPGRTSSSTFRVTLIRPVIPSMIAASSEGRRLRDALHPGQHDEGGKQPHGQCQHHLRQAHRSEPGEPLSPAWGGRWLSVDRGPVPVEVRQQLDRLRHRWCNQPRQVLVRLGQPRQPVRIVRVPGCRRRLLDDRKVGTIGVSRGASRSAPWRSTGARARRRQEAPPPRAWERRPASPTAAGTAARRRRSDR